MVHHFAEPAAPLNALTAEKTEWVWNDAHKQAFAELKRRMTEAPIFVLAPHPTARFIVDTEQQQRLRQVWRALAWTRCQDACQQRAHCGST